MRRFGRALFWLFDAVVIAVFACGYLAAYVHPITAWWLQPFAIVLPYVSILLLTLIMGVLALGQRRARLVHVGLLLLVVVRFAPSLLASAEPGSTEETLAIVVFNTRNGGGHPGAGAALDTLVQAQQLDILALQETWARHGTVPAFAPFLAPVVSRGFGLPRNETVRSQTLNLPILGNAVLQEYAQLEVPYWEGDSQTFALGRGVAELAGRSVVVYNVHLRSHGEQKPWHADAPAWLSLEFWRPYLRRLKQDYVLRARQATRIRELMEAEDHPTLLVGDFNSPTDDWVYRHLAAGMTDAFQAAGSGWGGTYHRELPFVRIDHVLLSPELTTVRAQVVPLLFSDHLPQVIEVAWVDAEDSAKTDER